MPASVVNLFNIRFDNITFFQLCAALEQGIRNRQIGYVVTPNVDHVVRVNRDPRFRQAYEKAMLRLVDGMPLILASRLLRKPLVSKLSGSDLVPRLSQFAAENHFSVFLFGAAPGVAESAAAKLLEAYPGLEVAGTYSPPFRFENDPAVNERAIAVVREARPDIVFIALGSPRQEYWLADHFHKMEVPVGMGVGASFDFLAGRTKRAPGWMQYYGMEWLWRLYQEPRRLWKRYFIEDAPFIAIFGRELWRMCRKPARDGRKGEEV